MIQDLGKRANVLRRPVAVLGLWHLAAFMILSRILLQKMNNVVVSGLAPWLDCWIEFSGILFHIQSIEF